MQSTLALARRVIRLSGCLGILMAAGTVHGEPVRAGKPAAAGAVAEALQREIYGLENDRRRLLDAAAEQSPQYAPAQWHRGMVQGRRNNWVSVEEYIQQWNGSRRMKRYEEMRARLGDTLEGQLALAEYCRREELPDQLRAALTRILEMAPDHEGSRRALGFVKRGPLWLSREQVEAEDAMARATEASLRQWSKRLEGIARDLASASRPQREAAIDRILVTSEPSAIPALEHMISPLSDEAAKAVIALLAQSEHPAASLSLARHAIYYPSLAVREAAADALAERDLFSFAPALLELMVTPVESRVTSGLLPTGRIGYRHWFVRQTQVREELLVLDTEYVRVALEGGSRGESRQMALAQLRNLAFAREGEVARRNDLSVRLNERVAWVLNRVTEQDLPASAESWWNWWEQKNQSDRTGPKQRVVHRQFDREYIVDRVPQIVGKKSGGGSQGGGGGGFAPPSTIILFGPMLLNSHCLTAGTIVWTAGGPTAIEQVRRGDLVLSQDAETGELAFKPVLRSVRTRPGPTIQFTAGRETIACSGGHAFWVCGEGWTNAAELAPGMLLHTASGAVPIGAVDGGAEKETFNLVVADFASYFVGQQKILAHDYTIRRATSSLVPGLKQP